jgi:hypothetical protein
MSSPLAPQEPSKFDVVRAVVEQINADPSLVKIEYARINNTPDALPPTPGSVTEASLSQDAKDYIAANGGGSSTGDLGRDPNALSDSGIGREPSTL